MRIALAFLLTLGFSQPDAALRIVVIEGEDAVNVIQQKTAVAPLVEVRDRNNLPVAGATVTFTIGSNTASFAGGVQTLTVATNAAGQAAAAAINPLTSGAVQINVAAAFQGQTAVATIAQTNVMTAAQAATAAGVSGAGASGGASGGSTSAAGGAAGGGGGISGTTIGIVGAAVAGGAVAATQVGGNDDDGNGTGARTYRGEFSGSITLTFTGCTRVESWTGTLEITLASTAPIAGNAVITNGSGRVTAVTCSGGPQLNSPPGNLGMPSTPVTGTAAAMGFTSEITNTFPPSAIDPLGGTNTNGFKFEGALNGAEITGTLQHSRRIAAASGNAAPGTGSASVTVTLR